MSCGGVQPWYNNYKILGKFFMYWKYTKMGYETFDRKNNVYVLNDNYGNKIFIDVNFNSITFWSDLKNNYYTKAYVYHILRKSSFVKPN